jgi:hypothetical protein
VIFFAFGEHWPTIYGLDRKIFGGFAGLIFGVGASRWFLAGLRKKKDPMT